MKMKLVLKLKQLLIITSTVGTKKDIMIILNNHYHPPDPFTKNDKGPNY